MRFLKITTVLGAPFLVPFSGNVNIIAQENSEEAPTIVMPAIPLSLTEPAERADYLIRHYWDCLDFRDTLQSHDQRLMEQSLVNFLSVMPYVSSEEVVEEGFVTLLDRSSADMEVYKNITGWADEYLFQPESPLRSIDIYILYLRALLAMPKLSEWQRARVEDRIEMVSKNRPGTLAADFKFRLYDGRYTTLHEELRQNSSDSMVIFFDPDCENCEQTMKRIEEDESLTQKISSGELHIIAIYSGDYEDLWRRKASALPEFWTVGICESEIEEGDLYYFPEMPAIYLMASDGTVKTVAR